MPKTHDNPGVIAPPPLLYFSGLIIGYALHWAIFWAPFQNLTAWGLGLVLAGFALAFWALYTMKQADTPVNPDRTPAHLVQRGPYRWSRNPIYLAMTASSLGAAIALNNGWMAILLVVVLIAVQYGVIYREERYLSQKFGSDYQHYKTQVRRWL